MENYSAPTGRLWFMYSNLELFWVQKACWYTAAEGQTANRTGTFTVGLLGSKLTSEWAAAQSPLTQRDRNSGETEGETPNPSLTPAFPLGPRGSAVLLWVCGWAHAQPDTEPLVQPSLPATPRAPQGKSLPGASRDSAGATRGWILMKTAQKHRHPSIPCPVIKTSALPVFRY